MLEDVLEGSWLGGSGWNLTRYHYATGSLLTEEQARDRGEWLACNGLMRRLLVG